MPGPTLPKEVATAPMQVSKSCPIIDKTIEPKTNRNIYKSKKIIICVTMRGLTTNSFIFKGNTARGCKMRLNSNREFLKKTKCRINLIPPLVEPAQAPENSNIKNIIVNPEDQAV